jgi:hypothetical protein
MPNRAERSYIGDGSTHATALKAVSRSVTAQGIPNVSITPNICSQSRSRGTDGLRADHPIRRARTGGSKYASVRTGSKRGRSVEPTPTSGEAAVGDRTPRAPGMPRSTAVDAGRQARFP